MFKQTKHVTEYKKRGLLSKWQVSYLESFEEILLPVQQVSRL